jgi:beta-lactam-binding protein with PASTA domain/predicted Ser/Thr protein kinase
VTQHDQRKKRVLAGRYEIDTVLGQGGMAKVFKGTDRVLGRTVAVKVLSPQFSGDDNFVSRFRREAQSAAGLNHPNIVSVYDTGNQNDVHYIVMEYIEGRTLRDVIRQEGPIHPHRAIEVGEALARALAAAHQAGLVHRDVKPGNIMFTRDGEVKVTDFGIARTSSGDTLTQTAAVLGTASYLSPEQAQGTSVDARSDIYSVGCVLYEMLTGRPPFTGDSPVSIAYKHVKEDPVPPARMNPDIPASLEAVVMKCMAKNPDNRYQTAQELREDLERLSEGLPTLATPVLPGQSTEVLTRSGGPTETAVMTGVPPDEQPGRRSRWPAILLILLLLAILGVGAFFLVRALLPQPTEAVPVPNVVGEREDDAVDILEEAGFQVEVERDFNPEERPGVVFEQDPAAGEEVDANSTVTITVSRGAEPEAVPGVIGLTQEEAEAAIQDAGFQVGQVTPRESEEEEGTVIDQDPGEGEEARPGSAIDLVVSSGPATVAVPNVICMDVDDAQAEIESANLDFEYTGTRFSEECPQETVAEQNPPPNQQVEVGTTVRVKESRGPAPTPPPTPTPTITIPTP